MSRRRSVLPALPKTMFFSVAADPPADPLPCAAIASTEGATAAIPAVSKNPRLVISCMAHSPDVLLPYILRMESGARGFAHHQLCLFGLLEIEHPTDAELISEHPKASAPEPAPFRQPRMHDSVFCVRRRIHRRFGKRHHL